MTYSIVARDPETGELGVAVQSHWFSVGSVVTWAWAGVGAVATQANALSSYGPRGLELMGAGNSAQEALNQVLAADSGSASRQVAMVDARGGVAAHTGSECIPFAGHVTGAAVSCQANIMASPDVWPAMLDAFQEATGGLADRLLHSLDAGEEAGGDLRGRQSAALLVVPGQGERWETAVSLRVEDHPEPLSELRRLVAVDRAYKLASQADDLVGQGRHDEAAALYREAGELSPDNHELRFWSGLGAVQAGEVEKGLSEVRSAIAAHPPWRELLGRLSPEVSPSAQIVRERLDETSGRDSE